MGSSSRWRRRAGISSGISLDADATGGVHESSRSTGGCTIEIMAEGPGQGEAGAVSYTHLTLPTTPYV